MRKHLIVSCLMISPAFAEETREDVLACFSGLGVSTEWSDCLSTMFAPCANEDVGSRQHIACLEAERTGWRTAKSAAEKELIARLSDAGMAELSGLMLAWPKFVADKCRAVAEGRAEISYDAADLGCQISEYALLTNEMVACTEGRSLEAYCDLKAD